MTCTEVQPLLSDLFDGELSDDARAAVDAHVVGCSACATDYRALRRTVRFVRTNANTPLVRGTPGGIYNDFTRAIVDDTYGRSPFEVILEGTAPLRAEREGEAS
jgi:anti-sigma factor RsiW